ncbi:MAG: hypothetical protein GTN36_02540 [Candidatus Aenigmarchaeota archaeon]|nr:hypothetical protein [Candidatus Aenigmarchaeota archaeon]
MDKKLILVLLVILSVLTIPALAAVEWTETILYFNVEQLDQISVQLLGQGWDASSPTGTATSYNIDFNSSTGTTAWANATVKFANNNQSNSNGIILIDNTGTTTPTTLNISTNVSNWGTQGSPAGCIDLHYFANNSTGAVYTADTPASEPQLNTTNVTLAGGTTFSPASNNWELWLWGNFSNCNQGTYAEKLYVFADFP